MTPPLLGLDHVALPDFDVAASRWFYAEVMGGRLVAADGGWSDEWQCNWLLTGYELPDGTALALFAVDDREQPPWTDRDDVRHLALQAGSAAGVQAWRDHLAQHGIQVREEAHDDGIHLYFRDPSGNVLELTPQAHPFRSRQPLAEAMAKIDAWLSS